ASQFPSAASARSYHEIVSPRHNWIDYFIHELRTITAIAIGENDDIASRGESAHSRHTGASITAPRFHNDPRTRGARAPGRVVIAAVIHHDDFVRDVLRSHCLHDAGDRFFFVERRNDHRYPTRNR